MNLIKTEEVGQYVEQNIGSFHKGRLDSLRKLKLNKILERKNPYLFKARNILLAQDLVRILLDAHLSSQEETIFGNFLEGLARFTMGVGDYAGNIYCENVRTTARCRTSWEVWLYDRIHTSPLCKMGSTGSGEVKK